MFVLLIIKKDITENSNQTRKTNKSLKIIGLLFLSGFVIGGGYFAYNNFFQNNNPVLIYLKAVKNSDTLSKSTDLNLDYKINFEDNDMKIETEIKSDKIKISQLPIRNKDENFVDNLLKSEFAINSDFKINYTIEDKKKNKEYKMDNLKWGFDFVFKDKTLFLKGRIKELVKKIQTELEKQEEIKQFAGMVSMVNLYDKKVFYINIPKLLKVLNINDKKIKEFEKFELKEKEKSEAFNNLLIKAEKEGKGLIELESNNNLSFMGPKCYDFKIKINNIKPFIETYKKEIADIIERDEKDLDSLVEGLNKEILSKLSLSDQKKLNDILSNVIKYNICLKDEKIVKEKTNINLTKNDLKKINEILLKISEKNNSGRYKAERMREDLKKLKTLEVKINFEANSDYNKPLIEKMDGDIDVVGMIEGFVGGSVFRLQTNNSIKNVPNYIPSGQVKKTKKLELDL